MSAPCPALGFVVSIALAPGADGELSRAWRELLEARGLCATGGRGGERREYVVTSEAAQATENDRDAVRAWLASRPEVRDWHVGEIEDLRERV